jgi:alpha-beta hydrolase superfamily lysophospholipase
VGADGVTAPLVIPDLHLVPGLRKIAGHSKLSGYLQRQFAVTPGKNFFTFPYDWRREARLTLVGHSMGGLVARYFLECLDGWRDTRRLVTFGTPYRGSLNAVNFLVHGMQNASARSRGRVCPGCCARSRRCTSCCRSAPWG